MRVIPSRLTVVSLAAAALACAVALLAGVPLRRVSQLAGLVAAGGLLWVVLDASRTALAWRRQPLRIERHLPHAFALGVSREMVFTLVNEGPCAWTVDVFDEVDAKLAFEGLPQRVHVPKAQRLDVRYRVTPRQRGEVRLGAVQLRLRSLGGTFERLVTLGDAEPRHVFPNFAAVARYAWLAGDKRLSEIGIKNYPQRGAGTDFKQLAEYKPGDPIRHIDWKATLRHRRPVVREFQDERDQRVIFLLDCGRRMRADEGDAGAGGSHFDQALNAVMLLSHVALKEGDEVGAMTFGHANETARHFAPRKGAATLNAMMARLYDIEPSPVHSDYLLAAQTLRVRLPKRALVILVTNFRDEDVAELAPAVRLLRTRHLVMVASLRERVLRELSEQPLTQASHAVEVATAHLFDQSRRAAFARVTQGDALSVDVEAQHLAVALVNRYHAVKRAGLL